MRLGDRVLILSETEDKDTIGVYRGDADIEVGQRVSHWRIIHFDDGHEGAYQDSELQVVDDDV